MGLTSTGFCLCLHPSSPPPTPQKGGMNPALGCEVYSGWFGHVVNECLVGWVSCGCWVTHDSCPGSGVISSTPQNTEGHSPYLRP